MFKILVINCEKGYDAEKLQVAWGNFQKSAPNLKFFERKSQKSGLWQQLIGAPWL